MTAEEKRATMTHGVRSRVRAARIALRRPDLVLDRMDVALTVHRPVTRETTRLEWKYPWEDDTAWRLVRQSPMPSGDDLSLRYRTHYSGVIPGPHMSYTYADGTNEETEA